MTAVERKTIQSVRHEYHIRFPANNAAVEDMLAMARADREAANLKSGYDDDISIAGTDEGLVGSWEGVSEIEAPRRTFNDAQLELIASALCNSAGTPWDKSDDGRRSSALEWAGRVAADILLLDV